MTVKLFLQRNWENTINNNVKIDDVMQARVLRLLKELRHRQRILKKLASFFKFVVVIGLNLRQLKPSLIIFAFLLFRWCFSMLENYYFKVSFNFEVIRKIT